MDDEAASQQLLSEARPINTTKYESSAIPLQLDGASQDTIANTPDFGKNKAKKPRRQGVPKYSHEELQAFVGTSPSKRQAFPSTIPSTQIEVPDTQTGTQPNRVPSPTQLTSSQVPSTSAKRSRKGKKKPQAVADTDNGLQEKTREAAADVDAAVASSASKPRKPRRKQQPAASQIESADAVVEHDTIPATPYEEVIKTPAATQDKALNDTGAGDDEREGVLEAGEPPLTPKALLSNLKAEKLKKSQSADKASTPTTAQQHTQKSPIGDAGVSEQHVNGYTFMDEVRAHAEAGNPSATGTAPAVRTPATAQRPRRKKSANKDNALVETPALDWEAPVRNLDETPAQPFTFEDIEDGNEDGLDAIESYQPIRKRKSLNNSQASRLSIGGPARTPKSSRKSKSNFDPNKNYQRARDSDDRTAADRALENMHDLGQPPDKRTGGDFTADERELLRRAIRDHQERNGLDTGDLVEIIHWHSNGNTQTPHNTTNQEEEQSKKDSDAFWDDIVGSAALLRKLPSIKKHVRGQYHMYQRGQWTPEEDERLQDLANHHPGQWKLIGTELNRLEIDVYNRWKDYVRHGENRNTKRWSQDEEEAFIKVLSNVCQRVEDHRAEVGKPPLDDYSPVINWHEVCREMGDTRSRLQCQSKWKIMKAREPPASLDIEIKPRRIPEPGQIEEDKPQKKRRKSTVKKSRASAVSVADIHPPGPEDMLWGDKFDLVGHLIEQAAENGCESDDQIVWQDVAEKMNQTWSVRTLQTAYKQLYALVDHEEDETLMASLANIYGFIKKNFEDKVEDRYNPSQETEDNNDDAASPNSSNKRKRKSTAKSPKVLVKRSKTKADNSQKTFKSKELITDSDNAESEPEA